MCVGAAVVSDSLVFVKLTGDEVVGEMLEIVSLASIVVTFSDDDDGMTTDKDQAVPEGLRCVEKIKYFLFSPIERQPLIVERPRQTRTTTRTGVKAIFDS